MEREKESKSALPAAKTTSKAAQIFAALWIVALTIGKASGIIKLEIDDIIYSGISIAAVFMPVYFSIWLEKIRDIRFGNSGRDYDYSIDRVNYDRDDRRFYDGV
jgi:hypothetical protein